MYCPSCRFPNRPDTTECEHCQADMSGLRDRAAVGAQFVFADASETSPLAISLDGLQPKLYTQPTVFSRHEHDIGFGDHYFPPGRLRARVVRPKPEVQLERLPAPQGPDLTAVITERKIYRPKEEAHIFVLAPDRPGSELELEVQLSGQQISKEKVTLDEYGLALRPYADLEEGEYTVLARRRGAEEASAATCSFSVAEFSLSPLTALLEHHSYEDQELSFRLRILALSLPYDGKAELGLRCSYCADLVVESQEVTVRDGFVEASFSLGNHSGPFRVEVITPGGETASVFFPGTGKQERERVTLCPLGRVARAGLLPGTDTQEVRGLHVGYDGVETTPVGLESAVARTGRLECEIRASAARIVTFHPGTGVATSYQFVDVRPGDWLEFPVTPPYTLFTVGLLGPRQPYEAWGIVIHPAEVEAELTAPAAAEPGEEIAVRITANRPAACLLLVYDARLEHESPIPKLGKRLLDAIREGQKGLKEQTAPSLSSMAHWGGNYGAGGVLDGMLFSAMGPPTGIPRAVAAKPYVAVMDSDSLDLPSFMRRGAGQPSAQGGPPAAAVDLDEAQTLTFVAVPSREDFPELAYLELFAVDGAAERVIPLGDQIGTWRCRAYLVAGLDVVELTADVEAARAIYAELDLPAIVGQGDDILASVRYHTQQPATMTINLPDGQTIAGAVMGHGMERFHLTEPGDITVHILSTEGEDWTTRTIKPPGVQTVTVSRLDLLQRGETVQAERVVVYPGPADVLQETIEALGRYPFG